MNKFLTALGDWWHVFRVYAGENFTVIGVMIMPKGPEKDKLDQCLYDYYIWSKDDE